MNGLEALQAMKEGKTVIRYRHSDHQPHHTNAYFRLDFNNTFDTEETSKKIWARFAYQKYWHECANGVNFWLFSEDFEIVEEGKE